MYYATLDSDDGRIAEDAAIVKFSSREDAETFLRMQFDLGELALQNIIVEIEEGRFSDCWIKSFEPPHVGTRWIAPFSRAQLYIQRPGDHPGGRQYWTTPKPTVLVAVPRECGQ